MDKRLRTAIKQLAQGNLARRRRAMEPFIRATFKPFFECLYRYLGNEVDCEDILEEVYTDIWENPAKIIDVTSERQLLRVAYLYYMRRHLRRLYRRRGRMTGLSEADLLAVMAPQEGVLDGLCQAELRQCLQQAQARLTGRQKLVVQMWCQGMSHRAIANELGTTIGAAKMLLYRSLLRLRRAVESAGWSP